jgi:gliding motility-associated protein GldM
MAGTKESPRQRMVGMMYLVLTALLALQVSSTIIEKFIALNDNMQQTVAINMTNNGDKYSAIKVSVEKRGNKPEEIKLAKQSEKLHQQTKELIGYMESLKKDLIQEAGGFDVSGNLKGANEETAVEVYMLGSDLKKGKAYELKARLNDYVKMVNHDFNKSYTLLALDGKEHHMYKNNPEHKNKDFAQLNFGQTPLAAALAVISEIETKVVATENLILSEIATLVGMKDYKFDKLLPMVRANSHFVTAGTPYQAEVFLAATSTSLKPEMNAAGQRLTVDNDGIGKYTFTASGGNYDSQGMLKKTWTASIKMKKPDGTDTVLEVKEDYTVVKPVIEFKSVTMESLYRNCANKMAIKVPALGAYYQPEFVAEGALLKKLDGQGTVTIQPQAATVKVKVMNHGQFIGERQFKVKLIPSPKIEVKVNNQFVNPLPGPDAATVRTISVKAIADETFKNEQPDDAHYEVAEWKITIGRSKTSAFTQILHGPVFIVNATLGLRPNDKILVEVLKVRRKNYAGQWEEVSIGKAPVIIPLN